MGYFPKPHYLDLLYSRETSCLLWYRNWAFMYNFTSCNDSWWMTNMMHKFSSMCLFLFTILYMFRAHSAHHQERQILSIQPLVTVILCWWPRCVHQHRMTVTSGCIEAICLSWWWARCARNM